MTSRRKHNWTLGAGAAVLLGVLAPACGSRAPRPNVILVAVDTLRADHLGVYGHERATSPRIDAFAREALLFRNAISPAPWTNPAMAAMFTGLAPDALGVEGRPIVLPQALPTLAEVLQGQGYQTHGIISHIYVGEKLGFSRGFDSWSQTHAQGHSYVSSQGVTDDALALLAARAPDKPFFLFLHYFDPHYDYIEHAEFRFSGDYTGKLTSANDNIRNLTRQAAAGAFSAEDKQHLRDLYDSEVAYTDAHLGRLFDGLESLGLYDDTLIVLTADHGESLCDRPDNYIGHARNVYQELVHVPLLIKLPDSREQRVIEASVSTLDVFPTVVDYLRLPKQGGFAERSLLRDLEGNAAFSATHYETKLQAVCKGRWKLIHDVATGELRLFDLLEDPGETKDCSMAATPMRAELEQLRKAWSARNDEVRRVLGVENPDLDEAELEQLRLLGY